MRGHGSTITEARGTEARGNEARGNEARGSGARGFLAVLAFLAWPAFAVAQEKDTPKQVDVARIFQHNCRSCHTVPDLRQELDRAWLEQVHRTA